jgi:dienelactone hydrolase
MRCLELILILACAGYFVRFASTPRLPAPWPLLLAVLLVALLLTQLVIEGWRLPMLPVYAVVLAAVIEAVAPLARSPGMRFAATSVALMILTLATIAALLYQRLNITRPTGSRTVGVAELPAAARAPGTGGPENLPAPVRYVWYPGTPQTHSQRIPAFLAERFAHRLKSMDRVPAIPNLTPSQGPYPVLAYVGGWPEDSVQNRSLICELVSRGFIVVSLQYPRGPAVDRPMAFYESDARFQQSVDLTDERARIYARDASAALDDLSRTPAYEHQVDLQRAGVFGYSFGGAVAAQATRLDPRFSAAVNIDGRHYADGRMEGVRVPYMFVGEVLVMPTEDMLKSTDAATRYEARADLIDYTLLARNLRHNGGIQATIEGTTHPNFSDDVMRSPLSRLSGGGSIDPARALAINNALVVDFFETRLLGHSSDWLMRIAQEFPETRIQQWQASN